MALMPLFSHCCLYRLSFDIWLKPLWLDLFPESNLSKNCRYSLMPEMFLPELLGEGKCGTGIMLLLAITTRGVHASQGNNLQ